MKRVYGLIVMVLWSFNTFSEGAKAWENEAIKMYQEGNYRQAIDTYDKILNSGVESAAVYYNLGNCYYKLGEISKAILNYERSLLLSPGDKDAKYNLKLAQQSTVDNIRVLPELFLVRWYNSFVTSLSVDQWAYVSVFLFLGFLVMAVLFFHATSISMKKVGFTVGVIVLLFSVVTLLLALKQYNRITERNDAIIMTPSVVVRGAPDNSGTELFVIHEGLKVQIIGSLGDWYNVRMADGNVGWILKSDLEKI